MNLEIYPKLKKLLNMLILPIKYNIILNIKILELLMDYKIEKVKTTNCLNNEYNDINLRQPSILKL